MLESPKELADQTHILSKYFSYDQNQQINNYKNWELAQSIQRPRPPPQQKESEKKLEHTWNSSGTSYLGSPEAKKNLGLIAQESLSSATYGSGSEEDQTWMSSSSIHNGNSSSSYNQSQGGLSDQSFFSNFELSQELLGQMTINPQYPHYQQTAIVSKEQLQDKFVHAFNPQRANSRIIEQILPQMLQERPIIVSPPLLLAPSQIERQQQIPFSRIHVVSQISDKTYGPAKLVKSEVLSQKISRPQDRTYRPY